MCDRFAQVQTRADYLDVLSSDLEFVNVLEWTSWHKNRLPTITTLLLITLINI